MQLEGVCSRHQDRYFEQTSVLLVDEERFVVVVGSFPQQAVVHLREVRAEISEGKVKNSLISSRRLTLELLSLMTSHYFTPKGTAGGSSTLPDLLTPRVSQLKHLMVVAFRILQHSCSNLTQN